MKRQVYVLTGLNCPHCAAKLEKAVKRLAGVDKVQVEYAAGTLTVESADTADTSAAVKQMVSQFGMEITTVLEA